MTDIIFRRAGRGPDVLALHAFPLGAGMWSGQLREMSGRASWWAPDLPGFGASGEVPPVEDLDGLATLIYEGMRAHRVARAVVAGCSMGGYLALGLLRVAPEFVAGLALINTRASADGEEARGKRLAMAQRVEREGCGFLVDEWPQTALSPLTISQRPHVVAAVKDMIAQATPPGVAAAQRAMAGRPDSTALLNRIRVPTLVIHGTDDRLIPEAEARSMSDAISGASFVRVEQAGHLPNVERPAVVDVALTQLLEMLQG